MADRTIKTTFEGKPIVIYNFNDDIMKNADTKIELQHMLRNAVESGKTYQNSTTKR